MSPAHDALTDTLTVLEDLDREAVGRLVAAVCRTHESGGAIFLCGNGGSAATASHFCHDLVKSTLSGPADDSRVRALALNDGVSGLTAWANDCGYEAVYEGPLRAWGRAGDLLIAISGSGNSPNVLRAVRCANERGIATFALTGFDGGELRRLASDGVHVPVHDMEVAENAHVVIMHLIVRAVREWKADGRARAIPAGASARRNSDAAEPWTAS